MDYKEVLKKALDTYGAENQTRMVFEEMAELQKELCKNARGADNTADIAEEIADVEIVLDQMKILHSCENAVSSYKTAKVDRLEKDLEAVDDIAGPIREAGDRIRKAIIKTVDEPLFGENDEVTLPYQILPNKHRVMCLTKEIYETTDAREAQIMTMTGWLIMTVSCCPDGTKFHLFRID